MLKREQIPPAVLEAAEKAHAHAWVHNDGDWWLEDTIAAAINAWPFGAVCHYTIKNTEGWELVLPLPQEKTDG